MGWKHLQVEMFSDSGKEQLHQTCKYLRNWVRVGMMNFWIPAGCQLLTWMRKEDPFGCPELLWKQSGRFHCVKLLVFCRRNKVKIQVCHLHLLSSLIFFQTETPLANDSLSLNSILIVQVTARKLCNLPSFSVFFSLRGEEEPGCPKP